MTFVDPTPPGSPQPEIPVQPTPEPEITPDPAPEEMPGEHTPEPGDDDSRPYDK